MPPPPPPSGFTFTFSPNLSAYNVTVGDLLEVRRPHVPLLKHLATGALVFSHDDHILLIQRAPDDSMPLKWEIPGGACDVEDETVLHGLARELWEESGLLMIHAVELVSKDVFLTRRGRTVEKMTFEAEVQTPSTSERPVVTLDPQEHVRFLWATEEECRAGKAIWDGEKVTIDFTTKDQHRVIMTGFKIRRERKQL
ncbi:protein kinase activating protein dpb11 [Podospora bellae-mahoneyi]|uniref:Protein kinase activating protein dpb11 n=1 Tax=Podospora bellae-mahoneyi TaxID=2093777 RepID=A0ABR0F761_9PEZI|nr:protein kinase activating protein dpb11 [Podospora bellae-mahoneyi]